MERVFVMNKYRLKFCKVGKICFIGHLDLMRLFQRALKRANLPISYSNGFNPHQIMSFAIPLPLGMESIAEYLDIQLQEDLEQNHIKNCLNNVMPDGIEILSVRKLNEDDKKCAAIIEASEYEITLDRKLNNLKEIIFNIMSKEEIFVNKTVKNKEKSVDIRSDIYNIKDISDDKISKINVILSTGSKKNLKPDLFVNYIYEYLNLPYQWYKIKYKRMEIFKNINGNLEIL